MIQEVFHRNGELTPKLGVWCYFKRQNAFTQGIVEWQETATNGSLRYI